MNQPEVKLGQKMQISTDLQEIYSTSAGAVYQNDRTNRLILEFDNACVTLKVDAFLRLKLAVDSIDLGSMATSTGRDADFELITVFGCDKLYVLSLQQVNHFKELLGGARFVLELNSMLHERLYAQLA